MSALSQIPLPSCFYPRRLGSLTRGPIKSLCIPLTAGTRYVAIKPAQGSRNRCPSSCVIPALRAFPVKFKSRNIRARQSALSHQKISLITRTRACV